MSAVPQIAASVLNTALRDEPWQDLGFTGRPKHGGFFQRFRPRWEVALERSILKEMIVVLTAAYIFGGSIREVEIDEIVALFVAGPRGTEDLWRTLGYTSRSEAELHLSSSMATFAATPPAEWSDLLVQRLDVLGVPDRKRSVALLVGIVKFAQTVERMANQFRARR